MAMAAPRSNSSIICSNAEHQTFNPYSPSSNADYVSPKRVHNSNSMTKVTPNHDATWNHSFETLLIQTALDHLFDGVLVVNVHGDIIQANQKAQRLLNYNIPETCHHQTCQSFQHDTASSRTAGDRLSCSTAAPHPLQPLLDEIWRVCVAVIDSRTTFPDRDIVLDAEVAVEVRTFRIRVRWMNLTIEDQPCLIVTIEDLQQTLLNQVNGDRWKYNLTPRETEVWGLKRRGYSYRAIAQTLYVSENTVKKHLKNIQSKRRAEGDFN